MADIRINSLTTTASSTASDDFIAVDGATNGTRKLNAYSPSFGGNATVAGAMNVGGVITTDAEYLQGSNVNFNIRSTATNGNVYLKSNGGTLYLNNTAGNGDIRLGNTGNVVTVVGTTASTSTSTGALVVSGGVGVAGAIYAGGSIRVVGSSHTTRFRQDDAIIDFNNTAENAYVTGTISGNTLQLKGNNGTGLTIGTTGNATFAGTLTVNGGSGIVTQGGGSDTTLQVTQTGTAGAYCLLKSTAAPSAAFGGYSFEDAGSVRWFIGGQGGYANSAHDFNVTVNGAYRFRIDTAGVSRVLSTTASTSTSTGALVVSGGVGVAGAMYVGGTATFGGSNAFQFGTNVLQSLASGGNGALIRSTISTASNPTYSNTDDTNTGIHFPSADAIAVSTGGTTALTINSSQNATFAGNITTAAPAGGTAAAWKLGTVASVSPTSPNRTIEVDIGGTIYYIHAKTTNN